MLNIPITFLGTSQAIPTATRNHTAILVNYKDENILVDCGEGTQRQFRKAKLNPCKITRILITHWHGDHVLGLPGLLQTLALNNYQKTLYIYGPVGTKRYIKEINKIFSPVREVKISVEEVLGKGKFFENNDFELFAYSLDHGAPCNGYFLKEKDKLRIDKKKIEKLNLGKNPEISQLVLGKDIKIKGKVIHSKDLTYLQKGRKISFVLDTRICANIRRLVQDSDVSIMESTYSGEEKELANEYYHMTCTQSAEAAKKGDVKILYLTHISQRYEYKESEILKQAQKIFKNSFLAEDLMKIEA